MEQKTGLIEGLRSILREASLNADEVATLDKAIEWIVEGSPDRG